MLNRTLIVSEETTTMKIITTYFTSLLEIRSFSFFLLTTQKTGGKQNVNS